MHFPKPATQDDQTPNDCVHLQVGKTIRCDVTKRLSKTSDACFRWREQDEWVHLESTLFHLGIGFCLGREPVINIQLLCHFVFSASTRFHFLHFREPPEQIQSHHDTANDCRSDWSSILNQWHCNKRRQGMRAARNDDATSRYPETPPEQNPCRKHPVGPQFPNDLGLPAWSVSYMGIGRDMMGMMRQDVSTALSTNVKPINKQRETGPKLRANAPRLCCRFRKSAPSTKTPRMPEHTIEGIPRHAIYTHKNRTADRRATMPSSSVG
jgi:hypothetical protein